MGASGVGIAAGQRLGNYLVQGLLGSGGMGEVYRARDEKLERDVAIKVLPPAFATDPERMRRFEQEARAAAALNHPNILAIFDFGTVEGAPYVVSELLEGETLRERIRGGQLPPRKAIEYTLQVARGLGAAHEKGIVHRDLKPENIYITRDGRVKILDFGLAKLTRPDDASNLTSAPTMPSHTAVGTVMGTVGYMSPEQVRGHEVDHRSDIFTFGAILYEMLSGRRAFQGDTAADTSSAILKDDPPDLTESGRPIPPALEHIVRHCLEKNPEERFQSARDLAFDLERLSGVSAASGAAHTLAAPRTGRSLKLAAAGLAALVVLALAFWAGQWSSARDRAGATVLESTTFNRLTYRRGLIWSARFAPDGQTVVYGGAWEGNPLEIFSTRAGSPESRSLGFQNADVLSVSSTGELAILVKHRFLGAFAPEGTLARVPLAGGAPRELAENIQEADWSPDGSELAVVRNIGPRRQQLEFPLGKVLYQPEGFVSNVRVSPDGKLLAFLDHPGWGDDAGFVAVIDREGKMIRLAENWSVRGLAWSPDGKEIWFTATLESEQPGRGLHAVTLDGRRRTIFKEAASLVLQDISRDGHVLLGHDNERRGILGVAPGETKEREWSWFDRSYARDLSADGRTVLFDETGESARPAYLIYLRKLDGSLPIRLGEGVGVSLSPDGRWALLRNSAGDMFALPTAAGERQQIKAEGLEVLAAEWFPDSRRLLLNGREPGKPPRMYVMDFPQGKPQPITPEGEVGRLLSPDGSQFLGTPPDGQCALVSVNGAPPRPIPCPDGTPIRWLAGGRSLLVREGLMPARIFRWEPLTGRKEFVRELSPADRGGTYLIDFPKFSADGRSYVYTYRRILSDLYLVDGLK